MTVNTEACWIDTAPATRYPAVTRSFESEVVVVGAGIVGLTTAWVLAQAGVDVTVLEGQRVARGVTARSTAKVTSQHALSLGEIARRHGEARARLYAEANAAGVAWIVEAVRALRIDCDLEPRDAYAYASKDERAHDLDREAALARKFGLPAERVAKVPLPFATAGGVVFRDQAQFNPARYLVGLAAAVRTAGGRIHERAWATKAKRSGSHWRVSVGAHRIRASHVVMACHMPIESPVPFDEITQPRCHLAMAFRAPANTVDGMFIGVDEPTHSLRMGARRARAAARGRRHPHAAPSRRRPAARRRRRDHAGQAEDRRLQGGQRPRPRAVRRLHAQGLHRDLEQRGSHLAVPVPRLDLRGGRHRPPRPGDGAAGARETATRLRKAAVRPGVSPRARVAA